jgi:hypothetical protein
MQLALVPTALPLCFVRDLTALAMHGALCAKSRHLTESRSPIFNWFAATCGEHTCVESLTVILTSCQPPTTAMRDTSIVRHRELHRVQGACLTPTGPPFPLVPGLTVGQCVVLVNFTQGAVLTFQPGPPVVLEQIVVAAQQPFATAPPAQLLMLDMRHDAPASPTHREAPSIWLRNVTLQGPPVTRQARVGLWQGIHLTDRWLLYAAGAMLIVHSSSHS